MTKSKKRFNRISLLIISIGLFVGFSGVIFPLFYFFKNLGSQNAPGHEYMRKLNDRFVKELTVSNDEKHIAFTYRRDKKEYIYLANIDGSLVRQISYSETDPIKGGKSPSFSKDSKKIVFVIRKGDPYGEQSQIESVIHIINISDGSLQQSISLKGYNIWEVVFSPDDQGLYFINTQKMTNIFSSSFKDPSDYDIYYISLKNQQLVNKTMFKKVGDLQNPEIKNLQLGKDGTISFVMSKSLNSDSVYKFVESSKELVELYSGVDIIPYAIFSTDGSMMVVNEPTKDKYYDFNLYNVFTHEKRKLLNQNLDITSPVFLNNSNKVLFFSGSSIGNNIDQGTNYELMELDLNSSYLKTIKLSIP